mmetsp:Transcript_34019/g.62677  ORF Transcript_34019/g.62677 Transcript_34019/m.62677 type:complete len:87 (-) Transcript_34019:31-291(-)
MTDLGSHLVNGGRCISHSMGQEPASNSTSATVSYCRRLSAGSRRRADSIGTLGSGSAEEAVFDEMGAVRVSLVESGIRASNSPNWG